jgi:type III pantothenate kinase
VASVANGAVLDVDVGNSRIKWRVRGPDSETNRSIDRSQAFLPGSWPQSRLDRIRVSSVASASDNAELRRWFETRLGCRPEFAETTRACNGLICGYEDPTKLGVDRWLAMLGAREESVGSFIVADLGTAATIDFVLQDGQHIGGHIVPGLQLMTTALLQGTAEVRVQFEPGRIEVDPGRTTIAAVRGGVVAMLTDFLCKSIDRFADRTRQAPDVYLCGGDANRIAPLIGVPLRLRPNLVLDGLAIALP